jgi:hypothetical protein
MLIPVRCASLRFRLLPHLLSQTKRPHVCPDFFNVSQTFLLCPGLAYRDTGSFSESAAMKTGAYNSAGRLQKGIDLVLKTKSEETAYDADF